MSSIKCNNLLKAICEHWSHLSPSVQTKIKILQEKLASRKIFLLSEGICVCPPLSDVLDVFEENVDILPTNCMHISVACSYCWWEA